MLNKAETDSKMHIFAIFIFAAISPFVLMSAPVFAQQLAIEWNLSPSKIGDFFFVELGVMSFSTIPAYYWSKRISCREASIWASALYLLGNLLSFFATSFDFLLIVRVIAALGGGTLMVITITSSSLTKNTDKTYGFWVLGQVLMGALALFILPKLFTLYGLKICYIFMIIMICIAFPFHRYFFDQPIKTNKSVAAENKSSLLGWFGVFGTLLTYIAIGAIWTFMSSIASHAGIDSGFTSKILAFSTLVGILGCFLPSLLGGKINRKYALLFGYILFFISLILMLGHIDEQKLAITILIFKFTWMFTVPFVFATVASHDFTGKFMNTVNLVVGGGLALGPLLAGRIIEKSGNFNSMICIFLAILICAFLIMYYCSMKDTKEQL